MVTEVLFGPAVNKPFEPGECELLIAVRFNEPETRLDFVDRSERIVDKLLELEEEIQIEEMEKYERARMLWQGSERM